VTGFSSIGKKTFTIEIFKEFSNLSFFSFLQALQHQLGDFEEDQAVARKKKKKFPCSVSG